MFPPRNPDLAASYIVEGEKRRLAPPQAVTVDKVEEKDVTDISLRNRAEEAFDLLFGEVLDRLLLAVPSGHSMTSRTASDSDAFP